MQMQHTEIDYDTFAAPPGHVTITAVDPVTKVGNTAIMANAGAKAFYMAIRKEAAAWSPAERSKNYELSKQMLVSDECRTKGGEYSEAIFPLSLVYMVTHPDKKIRKRYREVLRDAISGQGCHIEIVDIDDYMTVVVREIIGQRTQ